MKEEKKKIDCPICRKIPKYKEVDLINTNENLPDEIIKLEIIEGYSHDCQIRKCKDCGKYHPYYYDHDSELGSGLGYAEESIKRISPKKAKELMINGKKSISKFKFGKIRTGMNRT